MRKRIPTPLLGPRGGIPLAAVAAALAASSGSIPAAAQAGARDVLQVKAEVLLLADGERIEDGVLVVEDGKIARVGGGVEVDERLPWIEHEGVLAAGIVACQTESGTGGESHDSTRSLLPEARLAYGFDPDHSDFARALAAGITTVVVTPSGQNLAGGLTTVVKTHGGTVLLPEGHLALSFGEAPLSQATSRSFFFFDANRPLAATDGGLEATEASQRGTREPTSYSGALKVLRERLADPEGAFARAASGELPVFLEAWERHQVQRATFFATEQGLRGAVYGAPLAGDPALVELLAESGLGVVLGPYSVGQRRRSLESLGRLQEAGVPVAFALDGPAHDPDAVRLSAAMALAAGADAAGVWRALTTDAARIAGVDDRVGSLEQGKDADFVLWSGDPLSLSSRVEAVFVGGEQVHSARLREAPPRNARSGS